MGFIYITFQQGSILLLIPTGEFLEDQQAL